MNSSNEAFSRILIDKALEYSGWNLLDGKQVEFEYHNGGGRADYLLKDSLGRVLCVLEAKREDHDPYDAKEQGRGYAENLKAPFVILSNGREHWFWNLERANERDAYRIERLPSRKDLERVQLKNLQPAKPLQTQPVRPDFLQALNSDVVLRRYQIDAMEAIAKGYDTDGKRQFLLEMATGTGKTLLCAALIRRFLLTRNAERVLFIVDRIELAKQTMEDFSTILAEFCQRRRQTSPDGGARVGQVSASFYPRIASLFGLREPLLRPDLRSPQPSRAAAVKEARRAPRSGAQRPGRPRARRHPYRSGTTRQLSRQTIVTSRPPATGNAVVRRLGADLAAIAVRF